ncbi:MAG: Gfo/Idh/MocA family oxidoreductase [Chloroflexi bacterium]|nr:Gfo/Idh/MocA family oxidoreductase [Chloroflexota bacterium]
MSPAYKAAIVGAGSIGHAHMDGYSRVDEVEVVAVVDPVANAREQYQREFGISGAYETIEEMLAVERPDIVSVCTWHLLHPAPTIAAAQAGVKAVICEKPMAIGTAAANSMVEACDASGTKLVISHQRRFTPGWERAKELVAEGAIGKPEFVNIKVMDGLTNWGTHAIDGSRFVLGDPSARWVMGALERISNKHERAVPIEDACMGLIHLEGDVQLFVQSDLYLEGANAGVFLIRGTEGLLDVTETSVRLMNSDRGGWQDVELNLVEGARAIGGETNAAQVRELLAWIEGGPIHRGNGRNAAVTVEIMMAMYESARQNRVINLPLEETEYPLGLMIEEGKLPLDYPEPYDIRSFLSWEGIDGEDYATLRAEGIPHARALMKLHGLDGPPGRPDR